MKIHKIFSHFINISIKKNQINPVRCPLEQYNNKNM